MGNGPSSLEPELQAHMPNTRERFIGLYNLGNTCYANSVLQVLFRCEPFRQHLLQWYMAVKKGGIGSSGTSAVLSSLSDLFYQMQFNQERTGSMEPNSFLRVLRDRNVVFKDSRQQDAQEFLSFVLNDVADCIESLQKQPKLDEASRGVLRALYGPRGTFVHSCFAGQLQSRMQCLSCGAQTTRQESFFELSLDIEDGCSVGSCMKRFCQTEKLESTEGFHCESASCVDKGMQPAEKSVSVHQLPNVLVLHLKRFSFDTGRQRFVKLHHRVTFSEELKVWQSEEADQLYRLRGLVVHVGPSAGSGHYISCVMVENRWFLFNDDEVRIISSSQLSTFYGGPNNMSSCYMLFYVRASS